MSQHTPPTPHGFTPTGAYQPPAVPRKHTRTKIAAVLLAVAAVAAFMVGVAAVSSPAPKPRPPAMFIDGTPLDPAAPAPDPETAPAAGPLLSADDIHLTVKITKQSCYGSAGCNVEYHVAAGWPPSADVATGGYRVTYEVAGVEDGPQINTLTITDTTSYTSDSTEFASTTHRVKKLTATVTDVEAA